MQSEIDEATHGTKEIIDFLVRQNDSTSGTVEDFNFNKKSGLKDSKLIVAGKIADYVIAGTLKNQPSVEGLAPKLKLLIQTRLMDTDQNHMLNTNF